MKQLLYTLLAGTTALLLWQCVPSTDQRAQHWQAYQTAMNHGDIPTAIVEVNAIYAMDTTNESVLDTIMRLYFIRGNHISAYNTGNKIKNKQSIHKSILAESALQLGKTEEAKALLTEVESSDSAGLNIGSKYKLATLYFNDKDYANALAILGKIVENDNSLEQMTRISGDNTVAQNVSLYAASHNFAGYVFLTLNEFDTAEDHFNEALRVQPDFKLAMNNLEELAKKRKAGAN